MIKGIMDFVMTDERSRKLRLTVHQEAGIMPTFILYINDERKYVTPTFPLTMKGVVHVGSIDETTVLDWCRGLALALLQEYETLADQGKIKP